MSKGWKIEDVKEGFERFAKKYGHYPTAREIDNFPLLPTCRSLQRSFGGLIKTRQAIGLSVLDYTTGKYGSDRSRRTNKEAILSEKEVEKYLVSRFGEVCVHDQKQYGDKNRVDFFVYAKTNFGVDVFKTEDALNLINIVNLKMKKYLSFTEQMYFVLYGSHLSQKTIDSYISRKKESLPKNIKVLTFDNFVGVCRNVLPLKVSSR